MGVGIACHRPEAERVVAELVLVVERVVTRAVTTGLWLMSLR